MKRLLLLSIICTIGVHTKAQDVKLNPNNLKKIENSLSLDTNSVEFYKGRTAYYHSINIAKNPYTGKASEDWIKGYNFGKIESESWKYKKHKK